MYHAYQCQLDVELPQMSSLQPLSVSYRTCCQNCPRCEYRTIGVTVSLVFGAASAAALRYSEGCADGAEHCWGWILGQEGQGPDLGCFSATDFNTLATLVAICVYCASAGMLYHLQSRKRYVDASLVFGVGLALVIGLATGFSPREILFHLLPGSALAALVVSDLGPDLETAEAKDCAKSIPL